MSKEADDVWAFAIKNADYWSLLKSDEEPAEVAEMELPKREAFQAARREVQRRYTELLRAVWEELQTRTKETTAAKSFARAKYSKSLAGGALVDALQDNKGSTRISIEDSGNGVLGLYASFTAAKKRQAQQQLLMPSAEVDGVWIYYEQELKADAAAKDIAKSLVDKLLPELIKYIEAPEPEED